MKSVKVPKGKTFEFKHAGTPSKYKWADILNGELNLITKGEDFDCEVDQMPAKIKTAARRRYLKVSISRLDFDGNKLTDQLIVQSTPMNDEERAEEDVKRENEKNARKEAEAADEAAEAAAPAA